MPRPSPFPSGALRRRTPAFVLVAGAMLLAFLADDAGAGPQVCNRPTGPLPPAVAAAIAMPDARRPDGIETWGFQRLARLTRENRLQMEAGLITAAEAEAAGGTRITGTKGFPVMPFLYDNSGAAPFTPASLEDELFTGPWATGTMAAYYREISYNLFSVTGTIAAWTTLDNDDDYYEGNANGLGFDGAVDEAIIECLDAQDAAINFALYDNDGPDGRPNSGDDDGFVDFCMFVSPDIGGECGGNDNMWSHAWFLSSWGGSSYETNDNAIGGGHIRVDRYFLSAGLDCDGTQMGIGTTCHEFGHALDIKDLYDTSQNSEGLGHWCLMAAGNWNDQDHPAHMSAWCKERLGWLSYFRVTQNIENLCLAPVETNPVAVRLWTHGTNTAEYFVVENRQPIGFDDNLHANGLVIYHIDEDVYDANESSNAVNADETHKAIDVECADASSAGHVANADDLDAGANRGDAGDVWCSDTETAFTSSSVPDTRSYSGGDTECAVTNIGACDGNPGQPAGWICANYAIGTPAVASLCMQDCAGDGCVEITNCGQWWGSPDLWIDNDDDGADDYPADGVDNHLWFRVRNSGPGELADVQVQLYYSDPALGQLWPSSGTLIGTREIPLMEPGDVVEDYVLFEYPDPPVGVDHYCLGGIAVHPADPQNSEFPPNDNNVVQVNHQVLVARAGGKASVPVCPGPFTRRSRIVLEPGDDPQGGGLFAEIRLGTPPDFNDVVIPANWQVDLNPGPYFIPPGQSLQTFLSVSSNDASHGQVAHIPLTLWDVQRQRAAGGMTMDYRIDCIDPQPPTGASAACLDPNGDDLTAPNVKLTWPKVTRDMAGQAEVVKEYQVYRGHNQGGPLTLVDTVAIDAEPGEPGFQWYDFVIWPTGREYTYRVRALDAADAPGTLSGPIVVVCDALTDVGGERPPLATNLAPNEPNPFNPSTSIRFRLDVGGPMQLVIYDSAGRRVRTLVDETRAAGEHEARWDGRDDTGQRLASGVYVYRLTAPGINEARKLMLAK